MDERQAMVRFCREVDIFTDYVKSFSSDVLKQWPAAQESLEKLSKEINRATHKKADSRRKALPPHVHTAEVIAVLPLD